MITLKGNTNYTLIWAADGGHLDVVRYLVENGADIHMCDNYVLVRAAVYGHLDVVQYLVENGADNYVNDALMWATWNDHLDVVQYLESL